MAKNIEDEVKQKESELSKFISKHGPWAAIAVVLIVGFYLFTLQPQKKMNETLIKTIQDASREDRVIARDNRDTMRSMDQTNQSIQDLIHAMAEQQELQTEEQMKQTNQRKEALVIMGKFSLDVHDEHGVAQDSLDRIEENTEPDDGQ